MLVYFVHELSAAKLTNFISVIDRWIIAVVAFLFINFNLSWQFLLVYCHDLW